MTPEEELIWLGGLFDGEGTICLVVERKTGIIHARASVGVTNLATTRKIKDVFTRLFGKETRWSVHNSSQGYRPLYAFRVKNQGQLKQLCEVLLPYLVGKKEQAEMMLHYLTHLAPGKGGRFTPAHYEFVEKMKLLNKRYSKEEWAALSARDQTVDPHYEVEKWSEPCGDVRSEAEMLSSAVQ